MPDVGQHLFRRRLDVEFAGSHAQRLHQRPGIGFGVIRGRESRHRVSQDAVARQPQQIERLRADQQRLGGIQTAGNPDHHLLQPGRAQPLRQAGDLDVVRLVTILLEPSDIGRHEREALDLAAEADIAGGRRDGKAECGGIRESGGGGWYRTTPSASAPVPACRGRYRRSPPGPPPETVRSRPKYCRSRTPTPGRPRPGRWSIPPLRPRHTDKPQGSGRTASGTAAGGSRPCRW